MQAWIDFALMALTFFSTIFWNVEVGVVSSLMLSLLLVVHKSSKPRMTILVSLLPDHLFTYLFALWVWCLTVVVHRALSRWWSIFFFLSFCFWFIDTMCQWLFAPFDKFRDASLVRTSGNLSPITQRRRKTSPACWLSESGIVWISVCILPLFVLVPW